jgi:hypothetical protein
MYRTLMATALWCGVALAAVAQDKSAEDNPSRVAAPRREAPPETVDKEGGSTLAGVEQLRAPRPADAAARMPPATWVERNPPKVITSDLNSFHPWVSHDRQAKPTPKTVR